MSQSPSRFNVSSGAQQCDCDVSISRPSCKFGQSRAKVSAGFNVSSLAVTAFDLVYCSLSVFRFIFVLDLSK